jgi:hypothetical protein
MSYNIYGLVILAVVSLLGGWLWTRADRRKNAADRSERKP